MLRARFLVRAVTSWEQDALCSGYAGIRGADLWTFGCILWRAGVRTHSSWETVLLTFGRCFATPGDGGMSHMGKHMQSTVKNSKSRRCTHERMLRLHSDLRLYAHHPCPMQHAVFCRDRGVGQVVRSRPAVDQHMRGECWAHHLCWPVPEGDAHAFYIYSSTMEMHVPLSFHWGPTACAACHVRIGLSPTARQHLKRAWGPCPGHL